MRQYDVSNLGNNILTAIVPVHQMEGELDLLKSWLINCRNHPIEVRLVYDQSSDGTLAELKAIIDQLDGFTYSLVEGKYGAPGLARNAALKQINTEWVTFWDSDDLPLVEATLHACNSASSKTNVVICNFRTNLDEHNYEKMNFEKEWFQIPTLNSIIKAPGIWRWIFRAELLINNRFPGLSIGEDQSFLASILAKSPEIERKPDVTYIYTANRAGSITNSRIRTKDIKLTIINIAKCISQSSFKVAVILVMVEMRLFSSLLKYVWLNRAK